MRPNSLLRSISLFPLLLGILILTPDPLHSQISIDHSSPYDSPNYLVEDVLMGQGITATNVTFQGDPMQISSFDGSNATVPIDEGVFLSTGHVDSAHGPNTDTATSSSFSEPGDEDLDSAQGTGSTEDAAVLEFDFTPVGDSVEFNYVFASEEYDQRVCSDFNDIFGFFISGPGINGPFTNNAENIALLPGTNTEVAINSVNNGSSMLDCSSFGCPCNPSYYINNYWDTSMEFDGMTVKLTAKAEVQCGETYHIKLAVGDVTDGNFDSGVFLEAESFYSPPVTVNIDEDQVPSDSTLAEGCQDATFYFVRNNTDTAATHHFDIEGSAVNGVDYPSIPDSVTFAAGEDSAGVTIDPIADGVTEGIDTVQLVLYNVTTCGDTIPEVATLYIKDEYAINTLANDTTTACPEDTTELIVSSSGGDPPYDHTWSNGMNEDTIQVSPDSTDTLTVEATDVRGCKGIDSNVVVEVDSMEPRVLNDPQAHMRATQEAGCEGIRWSFEDESLSNGSAMWNFENGDEQGAETEVLVEYGTEHTATLIANDKEGCSDSSSMELQAPSFEEHFETKKPNVFTPNGDGKNDVFSFDMNGEYSDCAELRIFNRWGQLIFRSTDGNTRWDGYTPSGKEVPPGTYLYTLVVNGVKVQGELVLME